jgi:hypothetical protein
VGRPTQTAKVRALGLKVTTMTEDDDLAQEFLHHALMEETAAYLRRGRQHESLELPELNDHWVTAFRDWFDSREQSHALAVEDLAAELRLRGLDPPYSRIEEEASRMRAEVRELGSDSTSDSLRRQIGKFRIQRNERKN